MLFLNRCTALTLISVSFCLILASCGDSKMPQCNKLTETANKLKSVSTSKDSSDFSLLADRMDGVRVSLQKIELQDSKLKDFQAKLIAIYADTIVALKDKSKVSGKDTAALKKIERSIAEIVARENSLVDEINKYCGQ
jgi:hypothetical protein